MTPNPPAERPPLARRPVFWLIIGAALLVTAIVVAGVVALTSDRSPDATPSASPSTAPTETSAAPTPSSPGTPTTDAAPPPTPVVIPTSCDDIYTRDWAAELGGLVLNPAWAQGEPLWGSNDRGAVTMLEGTSELSCAWVQEAGGGDVGLITNVASLTSEQEATMIQYFRDAGFTCYEELSGTRCVIEETTDAGSWGESHFFREGVWIATRFANVSPEGYTHDIVAAIFG